MLKRTQSKKSPDRPVWLGQPELLEQTASWYADQAEKGRVAEFVAENDDGDNLDLAPTLVGSHRDPGESSRATKVAENHRKVEDIILKHLSNLYFILEDEDKFMEDPRVEVELREILKLKTAATARFAHVENIRSKNDRDEKRYLEEVHNIVYYLRKYRVFLHDLKDTVKVDKNVLLAAEDVLCELKRHARWHQRKEREVQKKRKERGQEEVGEEYETPRTKKLALRASDEKNTDVSMIEESVELGDTAGSGTLCQAVELSDSEESLSSAKLKFEPLSNQLDSEPSDSKTRLTYAKKAGGEFEAVCESYGTSSKEKEEQEKAEEFRAFRERNVRSTVAVLEWFINNLGENSLSLEAISYQMDRIILAAEGQPDDKWEIEFLQRNVEPGHEEYLEEFLLKGLKNYRVLLYHYPSLASDTDTRMIQRILEAKDMMETIEQERFARELESVSLSSNASNEDDGKNKSKKNKDELDSDVEIVEKQQARSHGHCSCGTTCYLAAVRPLTPESELPAEERELRDWYETNLEILKAHVSSLVKFLDLRTMDVLAGKTIDPTIILHAKKIRELDRGTMKEIETKNVEGIQSAYKDEVIGLTLKQKFINYYYLVLDPESALEVDEGVVEACSNLLQAASQKDLEGYKMEISGFT